MSAPSFPIAPRTDLRTGFFWIALGAVIVFESWRMDRLEQQGAELYTAPGLWPGVIGLLIALLGGVLAWRSVRRARAAGWDAADADDTILVPASRFALATAMFFIYALLLVGRGLPFWLATALFVTAFVFTFRRADRMSGTATGTNRGDAILAIICGIATAVVIPLVFEQLFFVRLP
jgi:putative tricarboxylic transport membrane protein